MNRFVLAFWLCAATGHALAAETCPARQDLDAIAAAVAERFYDKTLRGLDWPARVAHHRSTLPCKADPASVAGTANRLLAELHASHTGVYTKQDIDYWGFNSVFSSTPTDASFNFSGIWPERRSDRWYAKYVLEGSPAALAGVRQGDELLRLNGAPFQPLAFSGQADSVVISPDGKTRRTVSIRARHESVVQAFIDASQASRRILTINGRRVGYFHLWMARDAILEALQFALTEFEAARVDALILDFRGGYGGTSPDYLEPLRGSDYLMSIAKFVLIDDGVRSGKEMLAVMIRKEGLATLVGSRTAGAFLGAVPVRLFDNRYFLIVAAYGGDWPGLPRIEGVGVAPDVLVDACKMRCAARDAQLEKALSLARG